MADNGELVETRAVLLAWEAKLPLRWIAEPRPGRSRAANRLLELARGQLLLFTDDDVIVEPGWMAAHLRAARAWPLHGVFGGPIIPEFPAGAPEWVHDEPFRSVLFAAYQPTAEAGPCATLPFGGNLSIRASLLTGHRFNEAVGPSAGEYAMGGETELLRRLLAGGAAVYVPEAVVRHIIRPEQLTRAFVLARGRRFGRGLVHIGDLEWSPRSAFGAPAYLWRGYVEALAGLIGAALFDRKRVLAREFWFQVVRGSIAECRRTGLPRPGSVELPGST